MFEQTSSRKSASVMNGAAVSTLDLSQGTQIILGFWFQWKPFIAIKAVTESLFDKRPFLK
jgi:hypothetical protein